MSFKDLENRFLEISKITNEVEQSISIENICFEAETLLQKGDKEIAIAIFKRILKLDLIEEDLNQTALQTAKEKLIELGEIKQNALKTYENRLALKYAKLKEEEKLLAIAKTIWREKGESKNIAKHCYNLIVKAEEIKKLSKKDNFLKLELKKWMDNSS